MIDFTAGAPVAGSLDVSWIHGTAKGATSTEPPIQVQRVRRAPRYILRPEQEDVVRGSVPLPLLRQRSRVCLFDHRRDEGPGAVPRCGTPSTRSCATGSPPIPRETYGLVVAHTHGQRRSRRRRMPSSRGGPDTTVVPADVASATAFFGFTSWADRDRPVRPRRPSASRDRHSRPRRALDRGV